MQIGDKKIIGYFAIKDSQNNHLEYMIYSNNSELNSINISKVNHVENNYQLIKPSADEMIALKSIVQNLISDYPNPSEFVKYNYRIFDLNSLSQKVLSFDGSQKAQLNEKQYSNLLGSKYINISISNGVNNNSPSISNENISSNDIIDSNSIKTEQDNPNDSTAFIISAVILGLFFSFLIIRTPHFLDIIFKFDFLWATLATFDFADVFAIAPITYIVFQLSIIILLLAFISYNSEENHPIKFYFISVIALFVISIIYLWSKGAFALLKLLPVNQLLEVILKVLVGYALVNGLILTLVHFTVSSLTNIFTERLKIENFLSYYAIYLGLFLILFLGVVLFYDYYIFAGVTKIIGYSVIGGML